MPSNPSARAPRRRGRPGQPSTHSARRPAPEPTTPALDFEVVDTPPADTTFEALGVPAPIIAALVKAGCPTPFPIQAATLPSSLAGRDVLGRARTGSGKTVAFAVPTVVTLATSTATRRPNFPRALVLVPTRELAAQVAATTRPIASARTPRSRPCGPASTCSSPAPGAWRTWPSRATASWARSR
jgi:superfamily II DNA/RNA helicase